MGAHHRAERDPDAPGARTDPGYRSTCATLATAVVGAGCAAAALPAVPALDQSPAPTADPATTGVFGLVSMTTTRPETLADHPAPRRLAAAPSGSRSTAPRSIGATRTAPEASPADPAPAGMSPASPAGTDGAAVMADDLHQSDARQIAALSRVSAARGPAVPARGPAPTDALDTPSTTGMGAMSQALTRLGDPYEWGARGPHAFDCSGLVQWAFRRMGISLPRTSTAQSHIGERVSEDELRPGDLVFFYTPVSHVGIYIGHGKIVHASEPGKPVKVSPMSHYPYHNARRVS